MRPAVCPPLLALYLVSRKLNKLNIQVNHDLGFTFDLYVISMTLICSPDLQILLLKRFTQ